MIQYSILSFVQNLYFLNKSFSKIFKFIKIKKLEGELSMKIKKKAPKVMLKDIAEEKILTFNFDNEYYKKSLSTLKTLREYDENDLRFKTLLLWDMLPKTTKEPLYIKLINNDNQNSCIKEILSIEKGKHLWWIIFGDEDINNLEA